MTPIERAIELGFWPRLMGYLSAARNPSSARVAELAGDSSTGVLLSDAQAGQLLNMGQLARSAASSWLAGGALGAGAVPRVNLPASAAIDGGEPEINEVGLIINARKGVALPVQFSADVKRTAFQNIVEQLLEYISVFCGDQTIGFNQNIADCQDVQDVLDNWLGGNQRSILPDYIVERLPVQG